MADRMNGNGSPVEMPVMPKQVKIEQQIDFASQTILVKVWEHPLDIAPKQILLPFAWLYGCTAVILNQASQQGVQQGPVVRP